MPEGGQRGEGGLADRTIAGLLPLVIRVLLGNYIYKYNLAFRDGPGVSKLTWPQPDSPI